MNDDKLAQNALIITPGAQGDVLRQLGYSNFESLWDLARDFIEPPNHRRGGWSGVVTLHHPQGVFYVKRQENQSRYSLRHPLGRLTYAYEVDALLEWQVRAYPAVPLVAYGFRRHQKARQGIVVTASPPAGYCALNSTLGNPNPFPLESFRNAGQQLFQFHREGWQHGALYPAHIFMDGKTGQLQLIDLERSRRQFFSSVAVYNDLEQFVKRCDWLSPEVMKALLEPYAKYMPGVLKRLGIVSI